MPRIGLALGRWRALGLKTIRNGKAWQPVNPFAQALDQHRTLIPPPRLGRRGAGEGRTDVAETTLFNGEAEAERRIAAEAEA
jgi:hypothetical protein